jgi:hypothetical protein
LEAPQRAATKSTPLLAKANAVPQVVNTAINAPPNTSLR